MVVLSDPSALQTTWLLPLQLRLFRLQRLHSRRTGSQTCAHLVLERFPVTSQTCRTSPTQVFAAEPQPPAGCSASIGRSASRLMPDPPPAPPPVDPPAPPPAPG